MDRHALLCESCGYSLDGLGQDGPCPECARPIAHSLPEHRTGSPWQRRPGVWSWARTNWATLTRPRPTFATIRIEPRTGSTLLALNLLIAGALIIDPWLGTIIGDPARGARLAGGVRGWSIVAIMFIVQSIAAASVLLLLTCVEFVGVRFIAARRGWRLTPQGAWQVCCHASVGWIVMGVLPIMAMATLQMLVRVLHVAPSGRLDLRPILPMGLAWTNVISWIWAIVSVLAGLLTFEVLVYIGVRECRYAATIMDSHHRAPDSSSAPEGGAPAAPAKTHQGAA